MKDEVKDPELLEDSITRKCEENTINVDELSKMVESMSLKWKMYNTEPELPEDSIEVFKKIIICYREWKI